MSLSPSWQIALAVTALCSFDTAFAFVPSAALGAITPGESHAAITKTALTVVYNEIGFPTLSASMKAARSTILDGNAAIDSDHESETAYHCDAENLSNCNQIIVQAITDTVGSVSSNNLDQARTYLGGALHTLQDFYSHSNWIELGNNDVHPQLGLSGLIGSVAPATYNGSSFDQPTCIEAPAGQSCFKNNLVTNLLTSGYYGGQDRLRPAGKCRHGGFFDKSAGLGGINKDMSSCLGTDGAGIFDSPHNDNHPRAAAIAALATAKVLREIKARLSDNQFKALLGVGVPFAFAIDTTGSMGSIIAGVKAQVNAIIDSRRGTTEQAIQYVLAPFNDPVVPAPTVTDSETVFKSALSALSASGGGDCPELSMAGAYNAVASADRGAQVYVFTDASAKDAGLYSSVSSLANSKNSKLFFPLFGHCSPYDPVYFALAKNTGGQVFILNPSEAAQVSRVADLFSRSDNVDILSIYDVLTTTPKTYSVPVDYHISRLNISVAKVATGNVIVQRPDGSTLTATDAGVTLIPLSSATVFTIDAPQKGEWKIIASGTDQFSILANGRSDLSFDAFRFVTESGRPGHTGAFPIPGAPSPGKTLFAAATVTGNKTLVSYEFRSRTGAVLDRFSLVSNDAADSDTQTGAVTVPNGPFNVYAVGEDDNRQRFQRLISTAFNPQSISLIAPLTVPLPRGQATTYFFKAQNDGPADTFNFIATDDKKYITSVAPASASLASGQSAVIKIVLTPPLSVPIGSRDSLTLTVESTSNPDGRNFAVLSSQVVGATVAGDVNRDGRVDCDDLGLIKASFGSRAGGKAFNPNVDVDNNGVIDARDLAIVSRLIPVGTICK